MPATLDQMVCQVECVCALLCCTSLPVRSSGWRKLGAMPRAELPQLLSHRVLPNVHQ
jgi:hypothetical protein